LWEEQSLLAGYTVCIYNAREVVAEMHAEKQEFGLGNKWHYVGCLGYSILDWVKWSNPMRVVADLKYSPDQQQLYRPMPSPFDDLGERDFDDIRMSYAPSSVKRDSNRKRQRVDDASSMGEMQQEASVTTLNDEHQQLHSGWASTMKTVFDDERWMDCSIVVGG